MSNVPTITWRELKSYFFSPIAYIVFFVFYLVMALWFAWLVSRYADIGSSEMGPPQGIEFPVRPIFGFWFIILLVVLTPILTMRLFAEERRSGTMEMLMTAPVTDVEVTLGKYLAALGVYLLMLVPTVLYVLILGWLSDRRLDLGPILGTYLGIVLIGMLFLAMGTFASSLTRNQIIAAVLGLLMTVSLLGFAFLQYAFRPGTKGFDVMGYFSVLFHLDSDFGRGLVDTRRLIFYLTGTFFFLAFTVRMVEARKWK
jgi:ABC-2 type transport system permease protein